MSTDSVDSARPEPGTRARGVVLAAVALATVGTLPVFMLTAQAVLVTRDAGFSEAQLGGLVTLYFSFSALSSVPTGRVADRVGPARAAILAAGIAAATLTGIAVAPTSWWALAVLLVLASSGNSMSQAASNLMLAHGTPVSRQGLAFGIKQSAVPLAGALGGATVPAIGMTFGWRWGFAGAALIALLTATVVPRVAARSVPPRRTAGPAAKPGPDAATVRHLVLLSVATGFGSAAMGSIMAYLTIWGVRSGMSVGGAGLLLSLAGIGSVLARIATGAVADRRGGRNLGVVITHVAVGVLGVCLVATGQVPLIVVGAVLTISVSWAWPGLLLFTLVRSNAHAPAAATGIIQMGAYTGNAVGPGLFGALVAWSSFEVGWLASAACLSTTVVLMVVARRSRLAQRRRRDEALTAPSSRPGRPVSDSAQMG